MSRVFYDLKDKLAEPRPVTLSSVIRELGGDPEAVGVLQRTGGDLAWLLRQNPKLRWPSDGYRERCLGNSALKQMRDRVYQAFWTSLSVAAVLCGIPADSQQKLRLTEVKLVDSFSDNLPGWEGQYER